MSEVESSGDVFVGLKMRVGRCSRVTLMRGVSLAVAKTGWFVTSSHTWDADSSCRKTRKSSEANQTAGCYYDECAIAAAQTLPCCAFVAAALS